MEIVEVDDIHAETAKTGFVDGVMYITEPPSTVTALDVRTGRPLWTCSPAIPPDVIIIGSPPVNRGVAVLDQSVFVGTVHGHLIALDAKSGAVRWDVVVDDNKRGWRGAAPRPPIEIGERSVHRVARRVESLQRPRERPEGA